MNLEIIMNKLLLSCKEATSLIEKRAVFPLSFKERCRLYIHVKMCVVCNIYQHQSKVIEKAIAKWFHLEGSANEVLSLNSKERIIEKIGKN
jgi:hypothetical protein